MESKFKPVLVYVDNEIIDKATANRESLAVKINERLAMATDLIGRELSDEELFNVADKQIKFIDETLKKDFQFPNASLEFNLQAAGKLDKYNELKQSFRGIGRFIDIAGIEIKGGKCEFSQAGRKELIASHTHYTKNEMQNKLLKKFNTIIDEFNDLLEIGIISNLDTGQIERVFKFAKKNTDVWELRNSYLLGRNEKGGSGY